MSNIILPNGEPGKIITSLDNALPEPIICSENGPSNAEMASMGFKNPKQVNELKYIIKDILSGDPAAAKDERYSYLNFKQVKIALDWLQNNNFDEELQTLLMSEPWRLVYKTKPPTPEEFLSNKYIGAMADNLFLPVKKHFLDYFDVTKPYRNAYLNSSIGSGKQQPIDSPICIGEEPTIEFRKGGIDFIFGLEEDVFLDGKFIKAKELNEKNIVNFPKSINYLFMMIYNVERTGLFKEAFNIASYNQLISYFREVRQDIYSEWNIYTEKHHIIPRSEGGSDGEANLIILPYYFHILAHYLRGKEAEARGDIAAQYKNYRAVCFAVEGSNIPKTVVEMHRHLSIVMESLEKRNALEKRMIWITDGTTSKKIFDFEDIPKDWKKGRIFRNPSTKKWMNKDGKNYYFEKSEVEQKLKEGYSLGMFKTENMIKNNHLKSSRSTLGTKWMNKDGIRKAVKIEDVDRYLNDGWVLGSASTTCKGKHWTTKSKGLYHWYTNGVENVMTKECPEGYHKGRII